MDCNLPGSSSVHRLNHTFSPLIPYSHPLPLLPCVLLPVYFSLTSLRLSFHICEMGLVGLSPEGNGEETTIASTQQLVGAQGMSISSYFPLFLLSLLLVTVCPLELLSAAQWAFVLGWTTLKSFPGFQVMHFLYWYLWMLHLIFLK